jgi:glycosyltransferase involved in cell wall biosynthesis
VEPICRTASQLDLSPAARADVSMLSQRFMAEHHAYLGLMLRLAAAEVDVIHDNSLHHLPVAMAASVPAPLVKVLHTPPTPWLESALAHRHATTRLVSVSHANARLWEAALGGASADRPVVDRPVVDRSVVDRSVVDRPVVDRSVVDRSVVDHVVHNGVDVDRFRPGPGGGPALWSGRLVPEKAPHLALQAAHLAGIDLDLVGPVDADPTYVRDHVRPLLDDRRRWLGHLDGDALARALGHARVAVVTPDWDEPYGLVVAEALACGTPVAGIGRGALPELLTDEVGVLAPPGDLGALAHAILAAGRLDRRACRDHAVATASLDRMADGYLAVYDAAGEVRAVAA